MGTISGWSSAIRDNYRSGPTGFLSASVRFVRRWAALFGVALVFLPAAAAQASNPSDPLVARQSEPGPPGALQNVSVTADNGGVSLRWSAPADDGGSAILRYEVRSAEGATVPEGTAWIRTGTFTSFVFRQLTNGTEYAFEVRAVNAQGAGPAAQLQATPGQPSAPQSLTATAEDSGVVLRWSAPATYGGPTLLRYEVRSAEGASVPEGTPWKLYGTLTSRAFPQLTNGTLYSFEVRAVSAWGKGPAARIQATPGQLSAPQSLTATTDDSGVVLRWTAPANGGGIAILRYEVRSAEGTSVPEGTPWILNGTLSSRAFPQLTNGTRYSFEVRAVSAWAEGPAARIQATPGQPSAPQSLTATPADGRVVLRWSAPADEGSSGILYYQMRYAEGASVPEDTSWSWGGTTIVGVISSLTNGVLYSFEVRAVNAQGKGPVAQIQATPGLPPSAPQNLTATARHGEVRLAWEAPADRGSTAIDRYEYRYAEGATVPSETAWRSIGTNLSRIVDDLTNGTAYAFEVRAANAVGAGNAARATATPMRHPTVTVRPEKAAYRFAEGASGASIAIVAQGEQGGDRPSAAFRMAVTYSAVAGGATFHADVENRPTLINVEPEDYSEVSGIWQARKSVALSIVDDSAIEADEEFRVNVLAEVGGPRWVRVREADGTTACASGGCVMTVTIEDNDGPPSAPQDVSATTEDGGVVLRWSAPVNSGGSNIRYYEMRSAEGASVPASTRWISTGPSTTGAFRFLTNGTLYSFEVRAVNAQGEGPAAQIQATPGLPPSAPRSLTATAGNEQVTLGWSAPANDGGADIARYEVRHAAGASVPGGTAWAPVGLVTTHTVPDLTNGTAYAFEVRAVSNATAGETATTAATPATVPGPPQNFSTTPGDGEVVLTWQAPASNGGSAVTEYEHRHAEGEAVPDETAWQSAGTGLTATVESLTNGAEYAFEVRAVNAEGEGEAATAAATPAVQPTVPSVPQSLAATPGDGEVVLTWQAPGSNGGSAVTEYEYRHAEGASVPDETAWQSAGTGLTATVESLTNGTEYAFEVRAVNAEGEGKPAAATATPATVPGPPQNFSTTPADGQVTLTWQAPSEDGGSAVIDYEYRFAEGASVPAEAAWLSTGKRTHVTRRGLTNGTEYTFEVRAVNAEGEGKPVTVTVTPAVQPTVPSVPQSLVATLGDGKVVLAWQAPASNGGSAVTEYEYRHAEGEAVPDETAWQSAGTDLTATVDSLTNGTEYAFEVRAVNAEGEGKAAATTATPVTVPGPPQSLAAMPGDGEVVLTWQAPASNGGSAVTEYEYRHAKGEAVPDETAWQSAGTSLTATVESLTNGTAYAFEVRAVNALGDGSAATTAATPATVPGVPQNLVATPGDGEVVLGWAAPASNGGSAVTEYEYRHAEGEAVPDETAWQSAGTILTATVDSLTNGTEYAFEVRAVNAEGEGKPATAAATPVVQPTVPSVPQSLVATPGDGEVVLTWQAPASNGGSAVTEYEYRHAEGASVPDEAAWQSAGTILTATVDSLTNGTEYAFEVRAVNAEGEGKPAAATATPVTVPGPPQNFSTTPADGEVVLTWQAPASNGGSAVTEYEYRHAEGASVPDETAWQSAGTILTATVDSLTNGTGYAFEVRAVNAVGEGEAAKVTGTPREQATVPSAPRNLAATPGDGETILTWQVPASDGGSPILGYAYRYAEGASVPPTQTWRSIDSVLTVTVGNLTNGAEYAFEVRAENPIGQGSEARTAATPSANPVVTVHPAQAAYRFAEDASGPEVAIVARTGPDARKPSETLHVSVSTQAVSGGATSPDDFEALSEIIVFEPGDFSAAGRAWEARKTIPLAIVDDGADEGDESFNVVLQSTLGSPHWVQLRDADDTSACGLGGCVMTVTIEDDDRAASAPQKLTATPGDGQVALTWEAPADHGSSEVSGYEYRHAEGATVPSETTWQSAGTSLTAMVDSLTNGTEYGFEVRAVSDAGEGDAARVTATPAVQPTVPSVPQSLVAMPGDGEVVLTWQAPASNGGSAITRYEYRHAEGTSVPDETAWQSAGTILTATVDSLTNGTEYAFEVRAVNAEGEGKPATATATPATVVLDPAITVRPEKAAYSFDEDAAAPTVAFIARTASGPPRPSTGFTVTVSSKAREDGAGSPDDYAVILKEIVFAADDFTASGSEWEARKEVELTIVDDSEAEGDEVFDLELGRTAGTPSRIEFRQADGSACANDVCTVPVAIFDNDGPAVTRIEITPVPPEASADHGPIYRMDDFLAVPDHAVHGRGDTLTFTLTLDTEVTVTGAPELVLDIYDRERRARYTGGSGTTQLTFDWTVAKGDNDPGGLEIVSLDLNGGTIRDSEGYAFAPETLARQHFALHRVRGGLFTMRLEVSGSAREGEPFEIRVVRNGGYDEPAVAVVGVTDSAWPHIAPFANPESNGPGVRQFNFRDRGPSEPGARVSTRTVTPLGDGMADESRTLTLQLAITDAGIVQHTGQRIRAWYRAEEPLEVTVPVIDIGQLLAQAGLRVHDTSTTEAPGAKLVFRVTLSPHSDSPVTVEYRTGDDPANERMAIAGEDYTATDGTLTFEPGETLKTVEVDVLADDHNDGYETMRLILSNAQGARIDRASARGLIKNDGPIPRAWLGRFGRTVAAQVLDAVESRMRAVHKPGVEMTVAGQRVGGHGPAGGSDGAARLSDGFEVGSNPAWQRDAGLTDMGSRGMAQSDLLTGASFAVTSENGSGAYVSIWGRGAVTRFDGREGDLSLDGEVASAMLGADWTRKDWTAGLVVSRSDAEGGYEGHSGGRVEATLTGLYPWGRLALSDSMEAWGAAGYGAGELTVTPTKPGTDEDGATVRTDLGLRLAAAGLRGVLVDGGGDGLSLTGKTDALIVQTASDAGRGPDGSSLAAARATVTRLRLGLEAERPVQLGGGMLTPSVEIGIRRDGGDAETGFGLEVGGGIGWTDTPRGISAELNARRLVSHEARGFRDWGMSGSVRFDPAPSSERGLALSLTSSAGAAANRGTDSLFAANSVTELSRRNAPDSSGRITAEAGYGLPALGGRLTGVPYVGGGLSGSGRDYTLGWRTRRKAPSGHGELGFSISATRSEYERGDTGYGVAVTLALRW